MPFRFDNSYARLPNEFFAPIKPTPVSAPEMIRLNHDLAQDLGIDVARLKSPEGLAILSGNKVADGSEPIAMAYSGHQFGGFSPQLGDGRAILLGEVVRKDGVRHDIQLKGSGQTPFSRRGDGRSALGPVLREYIISEAMAALGVPTTRALAAVASGDHVHREGIVPGGVFTRVAQSHIRIGTFQWFAARRDHENLKVLADYVIQRHYPDAKDANNPYLALLEGVIERQAKLIAHWMQLGFIHGVMNTDNMTISGETIDYGPCAFMDTYHPAKTFSSIDHQGRYAFANQGPIAHWNLTRFAETLLPLLDDDSEQAVAAAEIALDAFADIHRSELQRRFTAKIGLEAGDADDWSLVEGLLAAMTEGEADFTLVFHRLSESLESDNDDDVVGLFKQPNAIIAWLDSWRERLHVVDRERVVAVMRRTNPVFIPRNHRVEEAITAAYKGDFSPFHRLNEVLQRPFTTQIDSTEYETSPSPDEVVRTTFCGT
ncbi:MAG TPA: YdiU family protein [Pirellulaceae bacterium]|nr:YdiU family protein [Planctomycetales bacterium]MCB9938409.1 YdiU family protein [Planctomycetaceae bacterium]HRX78904.1 YdiU family protein [Pirellulaceae bacterium]